MGTLWQQHDEPGFIFFRAVMDLSKAFANLNVVASPRLGRYELEGIANVLNIQVDGRM